MATRYEGCRRTRRQTILEALRAGWCTVRELSERLSVSEREVLGHLEHLERSLARSGEVVVRRPARCRACGFSFAKRRRSSKPSRCPRCRSERLEPPQLRVLTRRS